MVAGLTPRDKNKDFKDLQDEVMRLRDSVRFTSPTVNASDSTGFGFGSKTQEVPPIGGLFAFEPQIVAVAIELGYTGGVGDLITGDLVTTDANGWQGKFVEWIDGNDIAGRAVFTPQNTTAFSDEPQTLSVSGGWTATYTEGTVKQNILPLQSSSIIVDDINANFEVQTITGTINNGQFLILKPINTQTLTLKTGGNIDITSDVTVEDNEIAILQFHEDNTSPDPNGNYNVLVTNGGGTTTITWKEPCRIATTANISLSGLSAIDGVTPVSSDRVLVKNQTLGENNGIYIAAAGAWVRASDFDNSSEAVAGVVVVIEEGTINADQLFILTTDNPITLGTTPLTFVTISATGSCITAGDSSVCVIDTGIGRAEITLDGVLEYEFKTLEFDLNQNVITNFKTLFSDAIGTTRKIDSISGGYNFDTQFTTVHQFRIRNSGDTAFDNVGHFLTGGLNMDDQNISNVSGINFSLTPVSINDANDDLNLSVAADQNVILKSGGGNILRAGLISGQKTLDFQFSEVINFNVLFAGISGTNKRIESTVGGFSFDVPFAQELQFRVRNSGDTAFINVGHFVQGGLNMDDLNISNVSGINFSNTPVSINDAGDNLNLSVAADKSVILKSGGGNILLAKLDGGQKTLDFQFSEIINFNVLFAGVAGTNKRIESTVGGFSFDVPFAQELQFRVRNSGDTAFDNVGHFLTGGLNMDDQNISNVSGINFSNTPVSINDANDNMTFGVGSGSIFRFNIDGFTEYQFDASQLDMKDNNMIGVSSISTNLTSNHDIGDTVFPFDEIHARKFLPSSATPTTNRPGFKRDSDVLYIDMVDATGTFEIRENGDLLSGGLIFDNNGSASILTISNTSATLNLRDIVGDRATFVYDGSDLRIHADTGLSTQGIRLITENADRIFITSTQILFSELLNMNALDITNTGNITPDTGGTSNLGASGLAYDQLFINTIFGGGQILSLSTSGATFLIDTLDQFAIQVGSGSTEFQVSLDQVNILAPTFTDDFIRFSEITTPSPAVADAAFLYAKEDTDGDTKMFVLESDGTEVGPLGAAGTGAGGGAGLTFASVVKSADEIRISETLFKADSELRFNANANSSYGFTLNLIFSAPADGLKIKFSGPSGFSMNWETPDSFQPLTQDETDEKVLSPQGVGVILTVQITGRVITGSAAGIIALQWAQDFSVASNSVIHQGSWLRVYEEGASELATAGALGPIHTKVTKAVDDVVTNSTVLVNDSELFFEGTANKTYFLTAHLFMNSPSSADMDITWSLPTGAIGQRMPTNFSWFFGGQPSQARDITDVINLNTNGTDGNLQFYATITMGSTDGTVNFQFTQGAADAGDTKMLKGATLLVFEEGTSTSENIESVSGLIPFAKVIKTADEARNNDDVLQNDDELFFNAEANAIYTIDLRLWIEDRTATGENMKTIWTLPTGATGDVTNEEPAYSSQSTVETQDITVENTFIQIININIVTLSQFHARLIMGSTPGLVRFKWAQQSPTVGDVLVLKGSSLIVYKQ